MLIPTKTSTYIREKQFENFEDIKISVGTIYKKLKDNNFQWIVPSIISKNGPEQQKLRMYWFKRHKDRNLEYVMYSDESTFYLKAPGGIRWTIKNEQYVVSRTKYTHKINFWGAFSIKGKVDLYFFNRNLDTNLYIEILEFISPEINKIMKNSGILQFDNDPNIDY